MTPLARFLDAWAALCGPTSDGGLRALSATEALRAGTAAQREAVREALADLDHGDAWADARRLGAALRRLRGLTEADGRRLGRVRARINRWHVRLPASDVADMADVGAAA